MVLRLRRQLDKRFISFQKSIGRVDTPSSLTFLLPYKYVSPILHSS